ncbi:Basement membrane proteoglycan [Dirofilaria immitis]|nr:Basement membrane proteoglycan [Dirofilaria immitis]
MEQKCGVRVQKLIFWQGQQLGTPLRGDDYMSVGLNNGYLVFSYELGGGASQLVSAEKVNDDKEHELKIWRKGRYGKMTIDDGPLVTGSSFGLVAMLNVDGDIYIEMDLMANAIDGRNVKPCDQWMTKKRPLRSGKYY